MWFAHEQDSGVMEFWAGIGWECLLAAVALVSSRQSISGS